MQAPKTPFKQVKMIVEQEFGKPLSEVYDCKKRHLMNFIDFEEIPIASASLA